MEHKKKGILKNSSSRQFEGEGNPIENSSQGIRWDEEGILENEKERGGKIKIKEPKTPYHYYEGVRKS